MDPEEQELLGDYRYRNYSSAIDKALRNFESSSEWADLISSLGKLNKALQSNLKYSLLPRRLIISKRLSQCLHPALPTGVHIKALESYEVIFKIIGTKWLAKDLFLYSSGLFPLLGVAALSVKPVLLDLYENYFLPLQKSLLPSLQAFLIGLLPGLEEGSEFYDRTDALLVKLSLVIGKEVFYSALWASVLVSPSVRLPASLFVVSHINRAVSGKQQNYMMGTDANLTIQAICVSMLDSNVLVQRNTLEVVLFFFPLYSSLDPNESAIPLHRSDVVHLLSAAAQTLLRRDMSLNRRLYSWLLGSDIKGRASIPELSINTSLEDYACSFFEKYSKELLVEGLIEILHQKFSESDLEEQHHAYLKPFRILISLLDKPEIGPLVIADLFLEVIRAFYRYCKETLGSDLKLNYSQTGNVLTSAIKENKNASEIVKTANMLITSLNTDFLWDYMTGCIEDCLSDKNKSTQTQLLTNAATISELCTLTVFLLDVIPLELYSEVQSLYLPQMLSYMVQSLLENMEVLSLSELTYVLRTCFKVLSKVQMPSAYLSTETGSSDSSPVKEDNQEISSESKVLEEEEDIPLPSIKSEDSGIALSASSPELLQHLRIPRIIPDKDDVWKKGGSMQMTLHYIQELVAKFASKHIFEIHLQNSSNDNVSKVQVSQGNNKENNYQDTVNTGDKRHSYESRQIVVPQLKRMLSDFFTVRGSPFKQKGLKPCSPSDECDIPRDKEEKDWDLDQVTFDLGATREDCREAFSALCYLLLDCTTFPVYLSEEESELLYLSLFQVSGGSESSFPLWLKSLMTICCCVNDCYIQNLAISVLLEVINHSQSLALVIEDRIKRYKIPGQNPFFGRLQMVTIPPIAPGILKLISEKTDFYQRVAQELWNQLNKETREHHNTCVELFYRLHCLAPSANICEDIICHALLDHDKCMRLEALFRFSIMWHLTREIQGSRTTSHSRSFDRSLFVVLDSLNYSDGAISAAAQGWLIRALSLNDVTRILEPALLLLLHPKTQRISLHCIKRKNSTEDMSLWYTKKTVFQESVKSRDLCESSSEETLPLSQFTVVDREAIWAEVEKDPEKSLLKNELSVNKPSLYAESLLEIGKDESEHTESADTSTGPLDSDNTSSFSPSLEQQDLIREENNSASTDGRNSMKHTGSSNVYPADSSKSSAVINLVRTDSDRTRASESLSSDDEMDLELQALITSRLLKQQKEKQEMVEGLFKHVLLYIQPYDSRRVLYAFSVLEGVLKTNPKEFIEAVASTSMDTSSTAHLNLIYNLLARHQESLVGQSFYGKLQIQSPTMCPHSLLIELLMYLCLSFLRSYYPCYLKVTHKDVLGNRDVQVKSVEVLIRMVTQLTTMAKSTENKNIEFIRNLLGRCKIQEFVLLSLSASMYISQKCYERMLANKTNGLSEHYILEESLINFGHDQIWSEQPLQIELLKLLQVLIVLEHHLGQTQEEQENQPALTKEWQRALSFQEAINAVQYVHPHSITSQGLFVSAVVRGLQPEYGYGMHPSWVGLVTYSLPYFGKSLGWTVAPFIVQICKNLDELVNQYEHEVLKMSTKISASINYKRENITPDYPLTLLEGLTTIGHFCLLDHPNQTKKSRFNVDPTSLKNARNAILEELPQIINTMSLLWNVIKKEEAQKRPSDFLGIKGCSSIYFRATKILKNKILDFLNPLTGQLGVQLIAATAAVWSSKKPHKYQTKMSPKANTSQLILVDLICALSTLKTDIILQLIKEVLKKPSQIKGEEDVTQKILEAVGNVAASSLEQTSWLSRNLEVKAQSQISLEEPNVENNLHDHSTVSSVVSASAPSVYSVQALTLLAEVLASLLDMVYQSDEKEKAVPLISRLLYYVFPYLRNHSAYNLPSFHASTQLLSSLSGYAYTKRAWKKEVLDLFMDPAFFQMDTSCIHWRTIIDHLLTHEKTMFKDLMNMQSSSLKLFPSFEQKAMLLKRQAFAVFSGEIDQYHLYLPLIQERLTDNLRIGHTSSVGAQMFLFFRVLLLRISPQHLTSLWPIMVTELIQTFIQLEEDLTDEPAKNNKKMSRQKASSNGSARFLGDIHQNELTLYLSACKFLDTALSFPSDKMQLFQMWAFVPEVDMQSCSMISDVMESPRECKPHEPNINDEPTKNCDFPLLDLHSISNITQLIPFFNTLNSAFKTQSGRLLNTRNFKSFKNTYPTSSGTRILKLLEEYVERDFIDNMENESLFFYVAVLLSPPMMITTLSFSNNIHWAKNSSSVNISVTHLDSKLESLAHC
ncbi:Protein dopey-2, partial [Ophiophagus hannah]